MSRRFQPAVYNPVANPELARTNLPWRFGALLALATGVLVLCWTFLPPEIGMTHPTLLSSATTVTATSYVSNHTAKKAVLQLRFTINARQPLDQREVSAIIPAYAEEPVQCTFPLPKQLSPSSGEIELVKCEWR